MPIEEKSSDQELLARYRRCRDEAAFEILVRRYGPLVLGVCRRVIGRHHDAEEAFQGTFLVLAQKAMAGRIPEALPNWLYGVAYRTARETAIRPRTPARKRGSGRDVSRARSPSQRSVGRYRSGSRQGTQPVARQVPGGRDLLRHQRDVARDGGSRVGLAGRGRSKCA